MSYTVCDWSPSGQGENQDFASMAEAITCAAECYSAQVTSPEWTGYVATYGGQAPAAAKYFSGEVPESALIFVARLRELDVGGAT